MFVIQILPGLRQFGLGKSEKKRNKNEGLNWSHVVEYSRYPVLSRKDAVRQVTQQTQQTLGERIILYTLS